MKQSELSNIAWIFDPFVLLSPAKFWKKYFMQCLWVAGVYWDNPTRSNLVTLWKRHQREFRSIETISISYCLTYDFAKSIQLHASSDSSEKGYATAIYMQVEAIHCQLITGKSKIASLKRSTIHRLKLCAALHAAKLLWFILNSFNDCIKIHTYIHSYIHSSLHH